MVVCSKCEKFRQKSGMLSISLFLVNHYLTVDGERRVQNEEISKKFSSGSSGISTIYYDKCGKFCMYDLDVSARTARRRRQPSQGIMLARIADGLVKKLVAGNIIQKEQAALYAFGFEQGMRSLLETCLMLVTGLFLHVFWQTVVILLAYMPIRMYAGGYHAKTPLQCAVKSWILLTGVLLCYIYLPANLFAELALLFIVGILLWRVCPIPDQHKPLQECEIRKYRHKAFLFFAVDVGIYCVGHLTGIRALSRCVSLGMLMLLVILAAGGVKNWRARVKE